ncbi:TadE/TadG family type IV pilus assembly protein [Propioniciclava soli]|uniref:TadE/TadG family type IV pilus assembly protein n=1 Tax=Propioniciclava soli TaxID=2775081 RepID=UPI002FCD41B0
MQMLMLMPAILALMFATLQGGLYYYGRSAALAIANTGVRAAAAESGTTAACYAAAQAMAAKVGDALTGVTVSCSRSTTDATVTVQGTTLSVIPLVLPSTHQSVNLPVERITG